jgi:membrane protein DedA with SNARE-associated domain
MFASGIFDFLNGLTDWLADISANPWFYAVIFWIALLDSVVPIVPSESTVIIGGIAAGQGNLWIGLVILLGATGAFCGDSIAYFLGRKFRPFVSRMLGRRKGNGEEQMQKAADQIDKRGGLLLITARFIPGGRTLMTISCGATHRPYKSWFVPWDALAATLWASYAAIIGFFFGEVFEDNHSQAFWLAFGTALAITGLIEMVRWYRHRNEPAEELVDA